MPKKLTRIDLQLAKERKEKVVWVTAYDFWTANFAEQAGMEMLLVGDSLGCASTGMKARCRLPWTNASIIRKPYAGERPTLS